MKAVAVAVHGSAYSFLAGGKNRNFSIRLLSTTRGRRFTRYDLAKNEQNVWAQNRVPLTGSQFDN